MSQRALADAMTEAGWKWSHVTVGSIERGERPLRVAEAVGVASILGIGVPELVDVQEAEELRQAQRALLLALDQLQTAESAWSNARLEAAVVADRLGYALPEDVGDGLNVVTPLPLIAETAREVVSERGRQRWKWDTESGFLASKGEGPWVRMYVEAEEREHGEHPTAS